MSLAQAWEHSMNSMGAMVCSLRGYHAPRPCSPTEQPIPHHGHRVYWEIHGCACGWYCLLPYIVTAAGVTFLCDKCGKDDKGEVFWKWRTQ